MRTVITQEFYQKSLCTLLLLIFVVNAANSQSYKVRIAMMGNSITYGAQLSSPSTECYPAQLSEMLSVIYSDTCEIMNYGVSGRTMMRNAENPLWNEGQFLSAIKYVPDICLILLGTNDSKPYRWDAWGDEFLDDYLAMIDTFKFRNPNTRFIACYPTPIWEGHPYGTTFENRHNDSVVVNCVMPAIDTVVEETGAVLIDFHTPFVDSLNLFPDKLHPNAEGQKYLAEILYDKIIEIDLIHEVETGLAYISTFEQTALPVAVGSKVEIKWSTIFADSVFLDGVQVETQGSIEVIAEENKLYTLIAKGSKNASEFPLHLKTYMPEKSSLVISTSSNDYSKGLPVVLYTDYKDQYGKVMTEKTSNVTWSIVEGNGNFEDQTDTSIVFKSIEIGKVIIEAKAGGLSVQKTLNVSSLTSISHSLNSLDIRVWPNPVHEALFFQLENLNSKKIQIRVYNLLGEQLLIKDFNVSEQTESIYELNTSGLNQGVYVYSIYIDKKVNHGQFSKYDN